MSGEFTFHSRSTEIETLKTNLANGGGVSVAHGTAVWSLRILESMDSFRVFESRVGVLSGERMRDGVDVDTFVGEIWQATEKNGFMDLRLMLSTGQLVEMDSVRDGAGWQVLAIRSDQRYYPSGLKGRWVECFITGQKQPAPGKGRRALATA